MFVKFFEDLQQAIQLVFRKLTKKIYLVETIQIWQFVID